MLSVCCDSMQLNHSREHIRVDTSLTRGCRRHTPGNAGLKFTDAHRLLSAVIANAFTIGGREISTYTSYVVRPNALVSCTLLER